MPQPTYSPGQRVVVLHSDELTTETRAYLVGQHGAVVVSESGADDNGLVAVALDSGITRTFFPSELAAAADSPGRQGAPADGREHPGFPKLLTLPEAAALLRRTPAQLRWMRHTGTGPKSAKIAGRITYREADLLAWIDAQFSDGD